MLSSTPQHRGQPHSQELSCPSPNSVKVEKSYSQALIRKDPLPGHFQFISVKIKVSQPQTAMRWETKKTFFHCHFIEWNPASEAASSHSQGNPAHTACLWGMQPSIAFCGLTGHHLAQDRHSRGGPRSQVLRCYKPNEPREVYCPISTT